MNAGQASSVYKFWADILKKEDGVDYQEKGSAVIDLMANRYCAALDSGDDRNMNKYVAGLMLRFWNSVGRLMLKSQNLPLEYDDFISWLYEAINYACKYRAWQNPEKSCNAQQAINQCIETIRHQHYYDFNLDKKKSLINYNSMDEVLGDGEASYTLGEVLPDTDSQEYMERLEADSSAKSMIQYHINHKKPVEAIILDVIANNDCFHMKKETRTVVTAEGVEEKYTEAWQEFWEYRCVQILGNLPEDYEEYFCSTYNIKPLDLALAVNAIRTAKNSKLYRFLRQTLANARTAFAS